jgi:hypothetical protein
MKIIYSAEIKSVVHDYYGEWKQIVDLKYTRTGPQSVLSDFLIHVGSIRGIMEVLGELKAVGYIDINTSDGICRFDAYFGVTNGPDISNLSRMLEEVHFHLRALERLPMTNWTIHGVYTKRYKEHREWKINN